MNRIHVMVSMIGYRKWLTHCHPGQAPHRLPEVSIRRFADTFGGHPMSVFTVDLANQPRGPARLVRPPGIGRRPAVGFPTRTQRLELHDDGLRRAV